MLHDVFLREAQMSYRGISYDKACQFKNRYSHLKIPVVPLSRFGFASRKPIAECIKYERISTALGPVEVVLPYKLGLSNSWERQVDRMFDFFTYTRIKEIYLDEDISVIKNTFVQVAKKFKVPTYVLQHGALGQANGFLPLTADKIIVWEDRNKVKLTSWGLEADRIIVGGYDFRYKKVLNRLKENDKKIKDAVRSNFGLDDRPIIVFAPHTRTNFGDGNEDKIKEGIEIIRDAIIRLSFNYYNIIVKLHPSSDDVPFWKEFKKEYNLSFSISRDYDAFDIAWASSFMVVQNSTYAIDGLKMGKKVIVVDTGFGTSVEEYSEFPLVHTVEELVNEIK